jgi:hypothetical protein
MEVNIYIGFWTLEMKCAQYGLYGQAAFKNAQGNCFVFLLFMKSNEAGNNFLSGSKNFEFFLWGCPEAPDHGPRRLSTTP